jgi:hypothetical protein
MAIEGNQREFTNGEQTRLVLLKSADDLLQRDMDAFFLAYSRYPQGNTIAEDNGKVVRAAFDARWISELTTPRGQVKDSFAVNEMQPWAVRWAAMQIDAVIGKAREIPNG